ncbi:hypothetical protein [Chryseobacterium sp.]|nr:hypothetical protein [Chryseobacterium sp.]
MPPENNLEVSEDLLILYQFEDTNQAIEDSETGKTIKPVILIGEYKE